MTIRSVFMEPERFKQGWAAGFYDALSDDGTRYLDDILRYGIQNDEQQLFMAGYRDGRKARLGMVSPETPTSAFSEAA